jgi:hypothetical protein
MVKKQIGKFYFYLFTNLSGKKGIKHFVSTKSLDLGSRLVSKINNRQLLPQTLKIPFEDLLFANQVHGSKIVKVTSKHQVIPNCDGLITNVPNICLAIVVADCAPIVFFDEKKKVIGACHAGFKGTEKSIAFKAIKALGKHFNSNPKDIIVGIGPSIGPCHYERIDLWEENKKQLLEAGVLEENIEVSKICTYENTESFFSERKFGPTGRFAAGIMLA